MTEHKETKEEFFKRLRENKGYNYHFQYYDDRAKESVDEIHIEIGFKSSWKELRKEFVKLLRKKKESNILFNGWYIEREKEYRYPDKETMYRYFGLDDYFTGKYQIKIWKKDSFAGRYIYEKDFLK